MRHQLSYFSCSLLVFMIVFSACVSDLDRLPQLEVQLNSVVEATSNSLTIRAKIVGLYETAFIEEFGVVWSNQNVAPSLFENKIIAGNNLEKNEHEFIEVIENLDPDTKYYVSIYARINENTFYSQPVTEVITQKITLSTESSYSIINNNIRLTGVLSNMQPGIIASEHGHFWSFDNTMPTRNDGRILNNSVKEKNGIFISNLPTEQLGESLVFYISAFARIQEQDILSPSIKIELNNYWRRRSSFRALGDGFWKASHFVIDEKLYVLFGSRGSTLNNKIYVYDLNGNLWDIYPNSETQPGSRQHGGCFTIGNKGYLVMGQEEDDTLLSDVWEFDPNNTSAPWKKLSDFPSAPRVESLFFTYDEKGYLFLGRDQGFSRFTEIWEFNPLSSSIQWTKIADTPFGKLHRPLGFQIGERAYIGLGVFSSFMPPNLQFFTFNLATKTWVENNIPPFKGTARKGGVAFSIGKKGYIGMGDGDVTFTNPNTLLRDFWEYNSQTNEWIQQTNFGGKSRIYSISFAFDNKGYVAVGDLEDDIWQYLPSTE